jgi:acyl-CoA synthetase (AMP-forming)/AMP-acid ligase II
LPSRDNSKSWLTIPEVVASAGDRFGDAEAVVDGSLRLSFAGLAERVRVAAGAFRSAGVGPGDRVVIWAPNCAEWIVAAFGLLTAGGVLVPVSSRYQAAEAGAIIGRSEAKLVLVRDKFLGHDYRAPAGVPVIDLASDFLSSGSSYAARVGGDDPCDIFFTSGTTGRSKGVVMRHAQTVRAWVDWCSLTGLRAGDRYLIVSPFSHVFGYKAGCVAATIAGAAMLPVAVFDALSVLDLVEREKVTVLPGPPTLYHSLLSAASGRDLSSLRLAVTGGADIPVELVRRIRSELPFEAVLTGYGLTEAGGTVSLSRLGDSPEDIATTAGLPCDGARVAIAPDGEVLVRGYRVMSGYLDDPAATAQAVDTSGWLHTGDLGELDGRGRLRITGRKKDVFFTGGFNVYPAEVEGFLLEHPAVAQAAVVGVPDDRLGSVGKAFVVLSAAGADASEADLIAWGRSRMAGFKVPRSVEFVAALPVNAAGKVDKLLLTAKPPTPLPTPQTSSPSQRASTA